MSTNNGNTNNTSNGSNDNAGLPTWYTFEGVPGLAVTQVPDGSELTLQDLIGSIEGEEHDSTSTVDASHFHSLYKVLEEMTLEQAERTILTWSPEQKTELFHVLGCEISGPPEISPATEQLTKGMLQGHDAERAIRHVSSKPELTPELHHLYHCYASEQGETVVTKKANPNMEELMAMLRIYKEVGTKKEDGTYHSIHPQWRNYCLAPYADQDQLVEALISESHHRWLWTGG